MTILKIGTLVKNLLQWLSSKLLKSKSCVLYNVCLCVGCGGELASDGGRRVKRLISEIDRSKNKRAW